MRNRVIYQSDAIYVGPTPATGAHTTSGAYGNAAAQMSGNSLIKQLFRVQSAAFNVGITRTDVNQFGELAAIDRIIVEQPTVGLDLSYYQANFTNEKNIGLTIIASGSTSYVSCLSGILSKAQDEKNYFILTAPEGQDADNNSNLVGTGTYVRGFGNMFLSSYQSQGAVGSFPTATIRLEGLNYVVQRNITGNAIPAVSPTDGSRITGWFYKLDTPQTNPGTGDLGISVLRHGDISVAIYEYGTTNEFAELGTVVNTLSGALTSYTISYDLRRENLMKLGSRFAYAKEITYPLAVTCSLEGIVTDLNTGDLDKFICADKAYDIFIDIRRPSCDPGQPVIMRYIIKKAMLDGSSENLTIGPNKTFTINFSAQIGSAQQTGVGLFMSGITA